MSAGAGAGIIAAKTGTAALMFFTVATPADWVGLIVIAAAASMGMNYLVKEEGSDWYDDIMDWVDSL